MSKKIHILKKREAILMTKKQFRMKSKVQTYDIRDCEEYYGVLELERLLQDSRGTDVQRLNNNIRNSYNKQLTKNTRDSLEILRSGKNLNKMGTKEYTKDQESNFDLDIISENKKEEISELSELSHKFSDSDSEGFDISSRKSQDGGKSHLEALKKSVT